MTHTEGALAAAEGAAAKLEGTVLTVLFVAVILLAAAIRFWPLVTNPETDRDGLGQFGDTYVYHRIAVNVLRGHGFSTSYDGAAFGAVPVTLDRYEPAITRPPVYPFFLALVYSLIGDRQDARLETWRARWNAARFVQAVLDVIVCIVVALLARLMAPRSSGAPLLAAALYAFDPYNIFYTRALLSDSVAAFLLAVGMLMSAVALRRQRAWICVGLVLGIAALCRAELILLPPTIAGWLLLRERATPVRGWRQATFCLTGAVIAIAPWTIRNVLIFHRPVPIAVGALGNALFLGSFETSQNWRGWNDVPTDVFPDPNERAKILALRTRLYAQQNAGSIHMADTDRRFMELAIREIRAHPGRAIAAWFSGVPRLWYQDYIPMYRDREPSGVFFLVYFWLAIYAFARGSSSERAPMIIVSLLMLYLTVMLLPLHVEPRFSIGAMPGLIAVAGVGLWRVGNDAIRRWLRPAWREDWPARIT